jgi:MscS family membrane protein
MRYFRALLVLFLVPAVVGAQFLSRPADQAARSDTLADSTAAIAPVTVDSASPRASVVAFLTAARAGDFARAARWVDQSSPETVARAPELARRLKSVLDARLWIDLDQVSPRAEGQVDDGLPRDREELGRIEQEEGRELPVRMARTGRGADERWVFTATTLSEVDELYEALPDKWIREHLPARLLAVGPFDVLYWQWIALLVLVPLSAFVGLLLARPTRGVLRKLVGRTETDIDDRLLEAARGPIILLWSVAASRVLLRWVALAAPAQAFVVEMQKAIAVVAVFWMILKTIGVLQELLPQMKWTETHPALRSLVPLGARIARLLVVAIGFLTVLSLFGYPIATILAGLGIGGIAIALGAQKSLEHFFGSVSIGVDQPFRVGDWISVNGVAGGIEAIGLRSTRIRTMDRTLVSIPNGALAEAQTENFGERDRIQLKGTVGLEYGTSAATIKLIRDGIEKILRAHPLTWQERVQVAFASFGAFSLDVEFFCWLETTAIDEFRAARHEILLQIMEFVESNGASFAFPTQTIHVARNGAPPVRDPSTP